MANIFDGFKSAVPAAPAAPAAPAQNIFAGFSHPAADQPAAFTQPDLPPLDPRTATTGDYLARASGAASTMGQGADDFVRAVTGPFGDRFASVMGGGDLASQRALTAQAEARMPPEANLAASLVRGAPLAAIAAPGVLANTVLGGAAGYAGGLAGGDKNPVLDALAGAGFGGGGAAVGKGVGWLTKNLSRLTGIGQPTMPVLGVKAGTDPTGVPTPATGMYAQEREAYAPLDKTYFDTHGDALNRAQNVIQQERNPLGRGVPVNIPANVQSILTNPNGLANPEVTGRTIQEASRDLRKTGEWTGNQYANALDNVLRYDTPVAGGVAGAAGEAKAAGDVIHGRVRGLERLQDPTAANITKTQSYTTEGSPEHQALDTLQKAQQPMFNSWKMRHLAAPLAFGAASGIDKALDPDESIPGLGEGLRTLTALSLYHGLGALSAPNPATALANARYVIGTGQPMPGLPRIGELLHQLALGRAAQPLP